MSYYEGNIRKERKKEERKKPSAWRELNPQPHFHEASVQTLRYNRGPLFSNERERLFNLKMTQSN